MFGKLKLIIGSRNDRNIKKKQVLVKKINAFAGQYTELSDAALKAKTQEFRNRLAQGIKLNDLIPEAFALVKEASLRIFEMRHFDVQLIGGMILNDGKIAEMKTGEGKTLMATLTAYLNALPGHGVHIVTVNDYLANRDAKWMGQIYAFLGLNTGVIISNMESKERKQAYTADITYGTNNEFGFDYLRDNMAFSQEQKVQRELNFAIVDEVDSILIDEARTPLIISGHMEESTDIYIKMNKVVPFLTAQEIAPNKEQQEQMPGDYLIDEKTKQIHLTEAGHEHVEVLMVEHGMMESTATLYDAANIRLMHYLNASLRAQLLFQKNVDYVIRNDEIIIIDEFTGRMMTGRRWSEGLHQAIEAKEGVTIKSENQTLASITFQNYFRLYHKLSGMTGTADTEAFELNKIYGLEVVVIPTHKKMIRDDKADLVYLSKTEKYNAIVSDIKDCVTRKQPVLVGTTSIENSEIVSRQLKKQNIKHEVLNAKQHEREAHIIENAGMPSQVTIATNMAGRGTDIVLGGNLEAELKALGDADKFKREKVYSDWQKRHQVVLNSGGLHVIGSERHESRRVDNQLRGRSGRQGDCGSSRFYLSLEDDLMRIFASERVARMMKSLGMEEGEAIEHQWVTRAIENAQSKVEGRNFDIRKEILAYDDVANDQRKVIYEHRNELMATEDMQDMLVEMRQDVINYVISKYIPENTMQEQWDINGLENNLEQEYLIKLNLTELLAKDDSFMEADLRKFVLEALELANDKKQEKYGNEVMRHFEKSVMMQVLDSAWKEHLSAMDALRQGIHFRGYAQKDPKQEYKREGFYMFTNLLQRIKHETVSILAKSQIIQEEDIRAVDAQIQKPQTMNFEHAPANLETQPQTQSENPKNVENKDTFLPFVRSGKKTGRNELCPCGSKKKYKQCHGKLN